MKTPVLGIFAVLCLACTAAATAQDPVAPSPSFRPEWTQAIPEPGGDETPILVAFVEEDDAAGTDDVADVADPGAIGLRYVRFSLTKDAERAVKRLAPAYARAPQDTALPSDPAQREAIVRGVTSFPTFLLLDRYGNDLFRGNGTTLTGAGLARDAARAGREQSAREMELTENLRKAEEFLDKKRFRNAIPKLREVADFGNWPQSVDARARLEELQGMAENAFQEAQGEARQSDARRKMEQVLRDFEPLPGIPEMVADGIRGLTSRDNAEATARAVREASGEAVPPEGEGW
ncbi:MAG: hypothetical protein HY608_11975 [Planctomycetes bacterium]|nr:hypothetical protein [Planctomycetota bacterium]